ncbi:hypothetical protein J7I94_09075 [Streptomyces sp. ISL-12]|uniref:hypothetical protein n=1 Tax=Streptomyces sp. ISL-12 TaxID=2819177 RepID=UPI001BE9AD7E|nr:hypothetical protein [Streptomyces sp. ISL-12]MBT2410710.1 hypothetical protein [Streptomyces sp. ISL-12]
MELEAHTAGGPVERAPGRSWMVRLDPVGRGSAAVRFSCTRPACPAQRLPSAAAGRSFAVAHLTAHLRAAAGPRGEAYCACRADGCPGHGDAATGGRQAGAAAWRCGGGVVFAVVADRAGRWWQALECCARCAAARPGAQVVATAPTPAGPVPSPADARPARAAVGPSFSHAPASLTEPGGTSRAGGARAGLPAPRPSGNRPYGKQGKIAQRIVPHHLRPTSLRDELIELGNQFRAYQKRAEPDLSLLADLHARKARAFHEWADIIGDVQLRADAVRAEQAAATARSQHQQRTGHTVDGQEPAVPRVLSGPQLWEHARTVLAYARDHAPLPGPEARLLTLLLVLRTARTGAGNLTGQDLTALPLEEPEQLISRLTECGWLRIPGSPADVLASRPENPTPVTVPSLAPGPDGSRPLPFGKNTRAKLSGWTQRVVTERKLRKSRTSAGARLLALSLATRTGLDGQTLGPAGEGVDVGVLAALCAGDPGALQPLVDQLTTAGWLSDAELSGERLTGRLSERVWPLSCPVP